MKSNILPFYPGQKVICIKTHSTRMVIKDKLYIIERCFINCCGNTVVEIKGILAIDIDGERIYPNEKVLCYGREHVRASSGLMELRAFLFVPIEEAKAPLITFKEILEKERKKDSY